MSVVINSHLIDNGVKIKFRTINTYDNNLWVGYVEGIVTYSMARALSDVNKLHEEVLKDTPGVGPVEEQEFIILSTTDSNDDGVRELFAVSWINEPSLDVISTGINVDLRIYDIPESSVANAIQVLAEAGFKAKVI